jgi:transmembrane sensor
MTPTDEQIRSAIAEQAGEWFVANRAGPLDQVDRTAFITWLRASPVHVEEYLGVALIARDLPAAASDEDISPDTLFAQARTEDEVVSLRPTRPKREPPAERAWVRRGWTLAASAACALLLLAGWLWSVRDGQLLGLPKTYRTVHGQQNTWRLPDGSVLRLNTDSVVTVHYSGRERIVDVDRGEALFQVARADARRFQVAAGDAQVLDIGTEFDVLRKRTMTVVTVVEGEVAVSRAQVSPPQPGVVPGDVQRVRAGYQLRIDSGMTAAQPVPVDVHQALAWVQHRIVFENRPLGEVAEEFNRYASVPLVIEDAELRALPISGAFDAYDVDSFATFLQTLEGVKVERTPAQIRVLRMTPK